MAYRQTTLARAETAYRLQQSGLTIQAIGDRLQASHQTVSALLRVAREQRGEVVVVGPTPAERVCVTCGETMPITSFYRNSKGYYMHRCTVCQSMRWRKRNALRHEVERRDRESTLRQPPAWDHYAQLWTIGASPPVERVLKELEEVEA